MVLTIPCGLLVSIEELFPFLLLNMRLIEALSPVDLLGRVVCEGVDDMALVESDGPSDVRSVNLETCTG